MSSEEITLNSLNSQLVFQDDTLRYNCQQHRVGDSGPKTRELTGFIDDKIFSSVERDRYFRSQPVIYAEPSDRRDPQETRDWNGNADSPSTDESDDDDDDDDDDDELDEAANNNRINSHSNNSNISNCNNNNISMNCSVAAAAEKMGNGKAKNYSSSFGKNGNLLQTINNGAITTIAEADSDAYYSQYLQGTEGSSGSGQKDTVGVDSGGGISGSGESLRAILSDPVTGALMDDAMILPCGHSFGASGVQQLIRTSQVCNPARKMLGTMNVKIDKFNGRNNFSLWQIKMRALLKQQGLWAPLSKEKEKAVDDDEMAVLEEKAHSTIILLLADEVITEVADEDTAVGLWLKLESLYMTKSLTKKMFLKQRLSSLRMQEGTPLKDHLDELNTILLEL